MPMSARSGRTSCAARSRAEIYALGHLQPVRLELLGCIHHAGDLADHIARSHQLLERLEHVVGRSLAAGHVAIGAIDGGAAAVLVVNRLLEFLIGNGHLMTGSTELGAVGPLHTHVQTTPDDDA